MKELVRELCALSVLCGLALSVAPEGGAKRMLAIGCALALLLPVTGAARRMDEGLCALELERYRALGEDLSAEALARREKLERLALERECARCIEEQAAALGIEDLRAEVTLRYDGARGWVPERAALYGVWTAAQREALCGWIAAEAGVDPARQDWEGEDDG